MTVAELIEALQQLPGDRDLLTVRVRTSKEYTAAVIDVRRTGTVVVLERALVPEGW